MMSSRYNVHTDSLCEWNRSHERKETWITAEVRHVERLRHNVLTSRNELWFHLCKHKREILTPSSRQQTHSRQIGEASPERQIRPLSILFVGSDAKYVGSKLQTYHISIQFFLLAALTSMGKNSENNTGQLPSVLQSPGGFLNNEFVNIQCICFS